MSKITIVTIRNPFDLSDREIKELSHVPGEPVGHYLRTALFPADPGLELAVSLNGAVLSAEEYDTLRPGPGDFLAVCPVVGKSEDAQKAIGLIAMVALTVVSMGVAAALAASPGTAGAAFMSKVTSALIWKQAIIYGLGGTLLNYLAQPKIDLPKQPKASYGWGQMQSLQGQGNAVALTYGTVRTAGQIVAQHVESVGDKQYLNLLLCGGEGELDYPEGIRKIKINDSNIQNFGEMTSVNSGLDGGVVEYYGPLDGNQRKLEIHKRFGTNTQTVIDAFNDSYFDQYPGIELTSDDNIGEWQIVTTEGDNGTKLEVTVECPSGLYRMSGGDLKEAWVKVEIEYKKEMPGKDWTKWVDPETNGWIKGHQYEPVRKPYLLDLEESCRVQIRCKCVAKSGTDEDSHNTRTYLNCVSHIATEDFIRPGKALLGIRALATDRISGGTPAVTWEQTRKTVWVCTDPANNSYVAKDADNPAWACYDLIHRAKNLRNPNTGDYEIVDKGVPASRIDYDAFARWADFCDAPGDYQNALKVNLLIDATDDLWRTLSRVEVIGRGKVVLKGTRYSCICDCKSDPVQLFTMGNIVKDSFSEEFLPMQDRADAIEVSFLNKAKDYQRDIITVYEEGADLHQANTTQITLDGVTDLDLACQEAKYRLRANKYLTRTISFEADVDAIACQVGDVILFQHDLPEWGSGGRILAVSGNSVTLDRKVRLEEGKSYRIMFRSSNEADLYFGDPKAGPDRLIEFEVDTTAVADTIETDTLTLVTTGDPLPVRYDLYAMGEVSQVAKPFRVTRISRSKEFQRRISAIEYDERIINGADDGPLPVMRYEATALGIGGLTASSHQDVQGDTWLDLSWKPLSRYGGAKILIAEEEGAAKLVETVGVQKSSYSHPAMPGKTYSIRIHPFDLFGNDLEPEEVTYTVPAKLAPADVTGITLDEDTYVKSDGTVVTNLLLSFIKPGRPKTAFEIWYDRNGDEKWRYDQRISDNQCVLRNMPNSGAIRVKVIAVDERDDPNDPDPLLRSEGAISEPFPITGKNQPPSDVASDTLKAIQDELNRSVIQLSWQPVDAEANPDLKGYELRLGPDWEGGVRLGGVIQDIKSSYAIPANHAHPPNGRYTFGVKALDNSGNYSRNAAFITIDVVVTPNAPTGPELPAVGVVQDPLDRSKLLIAWKGIGDKDLVEYQVRSGSDWNSGTVIGTTKETSIQYRIARSGAHNIMIRAFNIAGYGSGILNLSITARVEPSNVAGLTARQSDTDRRIVKFTWEGIADEDFAYYEIRKGVFWDTAATIATKISSSYYDYPAAVAETATFQIKAFNKAGFASIDPAEAVIAIALAPSRPGGGSVIPDYDNRLKLHIAWEKVPDLDIDYYELKYGNEIIAKTGETTATYTVAGGGEHYFSVRAKSKGGFYSAALNLSVVVQAEPAGIEEFSVKQSPLDRRILQFAWSAVEDSDLSHYEIRKGANWDGAKLVATGLKTTVYETMVTDAAEEGTATFLIKAVTAAGVGSADATGTSLEVVLKPTKPGDGSVTPAAINKANLVISWGAVPDTDLVNYEVRLGEGWNNAVTLGTTRETSFTYGVAASGGYNFMICAKNVGGFYSSPLNLATFANVEPSDVTGFTASQTANERGKVHLTWNAVGEPDIDYYEIREGVNWDSGDVLVTRLTGLFYDAVVNTERNYCFWIAAVNKAGFYSNGPASESISISLTPSRPGGGSVIPDYDNRLKLHIAWEKVPDLDIDYYELKYGNEIIAKTGETTATYTVAGGGEHYFSVRAKSKGGFYSAALNLSVVVQAEPAGIEEFTVKQSPLDRRILQFAWSAVEDSDLSHYEIRKGANWDGAKLIATGLKTTAYETMVTDAAEEGTATFLIKAVTAAGVGSADATGTSLEVVLKPTKPGDGSVTPAAINKANLVISWGAVPDTDLVNYEVRLGEGWNNAVTLGTTRETSFVYEAAASKSYSFMVCSKNIGGFYSSPLSLSTFANIEPLDVDKECFSAIQLPDDRSKIRLSWKAVGDSDIDYYEIREGVNWDDGNVIATRLTGLFYDATIDFEREVQKYQFWIKAFNKAGKSSLNAAPRQKEFNVNPTVPSNLTVITDPNDKSNLVIIWSGSPDLDVQDYTLKVGPDWERATEIAVTKELKANYKPPFSGNYQFILKARNLSGFYSDEVTAKFDAYIEPADVTGFVAYQNGTTVAMSWDKSPENDVIAYEIREGSVFDNSATLVVTGLSETSYSAAVDTEITKLYHIKAINRAGKYSQNAATAPVNITNLPPKNVIETFDEIRLRNGTHENTELGESLFNFSNFGGRFEDYPNTRFYEAGGQTVLKLKQFNGIYATFGTYLCSRKDMGQMITANIGSQFVSSVLLRSGVSAKLQYRISRDGTTWTEWQDLAPVQATFRYAEFRAILSTLDPTITPEVGILKEFIDVPDVDKYGSATISEGGADILFGHTFYKTVVVTPVAIGAGQRAEIVSVGITDPEGKTVLDRFRAKVVDTAGNDVDNGRINWMARGF